MWVDSSNDRLYVHDGTEWKLVSGGSSSGGSSGGVVDEVVAGNGLTGGGSSPIVTLNVVGGDGITVTADSVAIDLQADGARTGGNGLEIDSNKLLPRLPAAVFWGWYVPMNPH